MKTIRIGKHKIGQDHPPLIIAEMSGNHNKSFKLAMRIVEAAAKAGAHALKLQTYTADSMTLNLTRGEFMIRDPKSLWYGKTLYQLYQEASTPWEWHEPILKRCRQLGLLAFSTPFDETAVDFLEKLNVPCYKIASFENRDIPLLMEVAKTGKPVIMSTGMASIKELGESVAVLKKSGCRDLILLKCTSAYPADPVYSHLRTIPHMRDLFQCPVGLSDHTSGIGAAVASVALGAVAIEKHFTVSRKLWGVDSSFSMEPDEMKLLVSETRKAWKALGTVHYGPSAPEKKSLQFRRSLYVVEDMKKGEVFTPKNLRNIRPGLGLPPRYRDVFMGKKILKNVKKGTALTWKLLWK